MKKIKAQKMPKCTFKRLFSTFLLLAFIFQYSLLPSLAASNIDLTGGNSSTTSINSGLNTQYDIGHIKQSGGTGFRQYGNFDLDTGDVANLQFNGITRFVNLVDAKININGIVNTMNFDSSAFLNGHAIFVSPNGMVIGAGGVLNVGALSIITPAPGLYSNFMNNNYDSDILSDGVPSFSDTSGGAVIIEGNGKIFSRSGVDIAAKSVDISGPGSSIVTGINVSSGTAYNQAYADALFSNLVNTSGMSRGTGFDVDGGKLVIKATGSAAAGSLIKINNTHIDTTGIDFEADNSAVSTTADSVNVGAATTLITQGPVNISSKGVGKVNIATALTAASGGVSIDSKGGIETVGAVTATSGGVTLANTSTDAISSGAITAGTGISVTNNGAITLGNASVGTSIGVTSSSTITTGNLTAGTTITASSAGAVKTGIITNNDGAVSISTNLGDIEINSIDTNKTSASGNTLTLTNTGTGKVKVTGETKNKGNIRVDSKGGIETALITASLGNINLTNTTLGGITTGALTSSAGNVVLDNQSTLSGITVNGAIATALGTTINNSGTGGINVTGANTNTNGDILITNAIGDIVLNALSTGLGKITVTNNGAGKIEVTNALSNTNGDITVLNNSSSGTTLRLGSAETNQGLISITNKGTGLTTIVGLLKSLVGNISVNSSKGVLAQVIEATSGGVTLANTSTDAISSGAITAGTGISVTNNGAITLGNASAGTSIGVTSSSTITTGNLTAGTTITASSAGAVKTGIITNNDGAVSISTNLGDIEINSIDTNKTSASGNTLTLTNTGTGKVKVTGATKNKGNIRVDSKGGVEVADVSTSLGNIALYNAISGVVTVGALNATSGINVDNTAAGAVTIGALAKTTGGTLEINSINGISTQGLEATAGQIIVSNTAGAISTTTLTAGTGISVTNTSNGSLTVGGLARTTAGGVNISSQGGIIAQVIQASAGMIRLTNNGTGGLQAGQLTAGTGIVINNTGNAIVNLTGNASTTASDIEINSNYGITTQGLTSAAKITVANTAAGAVSTGAVSNTNGEVSISNSSGNITIVSLNTNTSSPSGNLVSVQTTGIGVNKGKVRINTTANNKGNIQINSTGGIETVGAVTATSGGVTLANTSTDAISSGAITAGTGISVTNNGAITLGNASVGTSIGVTSSSTITTGNLTAGTTITASSAGAVKTGIITNNDGAVSISTSSGDIEINSIDTNKTSASGNTLTLTNTGTGKVKVTGETKNKGNIRVDSKGGIETALITASLGNINLTNTTLGGITTGALTSSAGSVYVDNQSLVSGLNVGNVWAAAIIDLKNAGAGGLTAGSLTAGTKILLANTSASGGINIGTTTLTTGDIDITNASGSIILDSLKTSIGNITVTNNGVGAITIANKVENTQGNISIYNNQTTGTSLSIGSISTTEGNVYINNQGTELLTVTGDTATGKGTVTFINKGKGITAGKITSNTAVGATGDVIITSQGDGKVTITDKITNTKGNVDISSAAGIDTKAIEAKDGNIILGNTTKGGILTTNLDAVQGSVSVSNTSALAGATTGAITAGTSIGVTSSSTITTGNLTAGTAITATGAGAVRTGTITNNDGAVSISTNLGDIEINSIDTNKTSASGNTLTLTNTGTGKVKVTGETKNKGNIQVNSKGGIETALITATLGNINLTNTTLGGITTDALTSSAGSVVLDNQSTLSGITVNGAIATALGTTINNSGTGGINVTGANTNTNGDILIINDIGDIVLNALSTGLGKITVTNNGAGRIGITNAVSNNEGDIAITNTSGTTLSVGSITTNKSSLSVTNGGTGLMSIAGGITNKNGSVILNNTGTGITAGAITTNESLLGTNAITITNSGAGKITLTGALTNNKGDITLTNNSTDALAGITTNTITTDEGTVSINNKGTAGLSTAVITNRNGAINIKNEGGGVGISSIRANSNATLKSNVLVENTGTGSINISGDVANRMGDVTIDNQNSASSGIILSSVNTTEANNIEGNILIKNAGNNGINISGKIFTKKGNININNINADTAVASKVAVGVSGSIKTDEGIISVSNAGGGGVDIKGAVTNTKGTGTSAVSINNTQGGVSLASVTANGTGVGIGIINILNSGLGGVNVSGNIINNNAGITINNTNTGASGINAAILTATAGDIILSNSGSNKIDITGTTTANKGNITVTSAGGVKMATVSSINDTGTLNKKNISITNTGVNGVEITGVVSNNNGDIAVTNSKGGILMSTIDATIGTVSLTNNIGGTGGINVTGTITNKDGEIIVDNQDTGASGIKLNTVAANATGNANNISITNAGTGLTQVTGNISNKSGNITITNNNAAATSGISLNSVTAEAGNILVNNTNGGQGIGISGKIWNKLGNITVNNQDSSATSKVSIALAGSLEADAGTINVSNAGGGGIDAVGDIINHKGIINITGTNGAIKLGKVTSNDSPTASASAITINNTGAGGIDITNAITNGRGDILITNNNNTPNASASKINIANGVTVSTEQGVILVENTGAGGINVAGNITNKDGNITVKNNAMTETTSLVNIAGTVSTDTGNELKIENAAGGGINISGIVRNKKGKVTVNNTAGGINVGTLGLIESNTNAASGDSAVELLVTNSGAGGVKIDGTVVNKKGNLSINNSGGGITGTGLIQTNENGSVDAELLVTNSVAGTGGINFAGRIFNKKGNVKVESSAGGITLGSATVSNTGVEATNTILIDNKGDKGINILRRVFTSNGNVTLSNSASGTENINIAATGNVETTLGNVVISNNGTAGIDVQGRVFTSDGNVTLTNSINGTQKINIADTGNVQTTRGDILVSNAGITDINIDGIVKTSDGNVAITNSNTGASGITGSVRTALIEGSTTSPVLITNKGTGGINYLGTINNKKGTVTITNDTLGAGGITLGSVNANQDLTARELLIDNKGDGGITIIGAIHNFTGNTKLFNQNTGGATSVVKVSNTGSILNDKGDIFIDNLASSGDVIIENSIKTSEGNIQIDNANSDIIIGYKANSGINTNTDLNKKYVEALNGNGSDLSKGNVTITQKEGNILNAGVNQTLIYAIQDIVLDVVDGNIGAAQACADLGVVPGYSAAGSTRGLYPGQSGPVTVGLFEETINITAGGNIKAKAINSSGGFSGIDRLINLRSVKSNMVIDEILCHGNIMLTAADWVSDNPNSPDYYKGYSIINANTTPYRTNIDVHGKNISMIASDNVGSGSGENERLSYVSEHVLNDSITVCFEARNNVYINDQGTVKANVLQVIAQTGDVYWDSGYGSQDPSTRNETAIIQEISASGHLNIVHKGKELIIYNLGYSKGIDDDLLSYRIGGGSVIPNTISVFVLDVHGGANANAVLNIYNAQLRGANNGNGAYDAHGNRISDVVLRADTIIANAYGSPDSYVSTLNNPNGISGTDNRTYSYIDKSDGVTVVSGKATGFNAVGQGNTLVFDIRGVDPDLVADLTKNDDPTKVNPNRIYYPQNIANEQPNPFPNPYHKPSNQVPEGYYTTKEVRLSVNSNDNTTANRGVEFNYLYADDAYIDTRDLNLTVWDAVINNYAEFRNGNRGGTGGYQGNYRWTTVVDNSFRRLVNLQGVTLLNLQLFTRDTGSFYLGLDNTISLKTSAPAVFYNAHEVANQFGTENSFYRITYKDDRIQESTIDESFEDVDKDTHKPTKRLAIRFIIPGESLVEVDDTRITEVVDISRTGLAVLHTGALKIGEELKVKLGYSGVEADVEAKIIRVNGNSAGLQFINLDKATANKLLYINMMLAAAKDSEGAESRVSL